MEVAYTGSICPALDAAVALPVVLSALAVPLGGVEKRLSVTELTRIRWRQSPAMIPIKGDCETRS
jgi:hypothetical protein